MQLLCFSTQCVENQEKKNIVWEHLIDLFSINIFATCHLRKLTYYNYKAYLQLQFSLIEK